jgi:hypothetical protein
MLGYLSARLGESINHQPYRNAALRADSKWSILRLSGAILYSYFLLLRIFPPFMTQFCEFYAKFLQCVLRDFLRFTRFAFSFLAKLRGSQGWEIRNSSNCRRCENPPLAIEPANVPKVKLLAETNPFVESVQPGDLLLEINFFGLNQVLDLAIFENCPSVG